MTLFDTIETERSLRPMWEHQEDSYQGLRAAFKSGWRCPVLYLPTGGGKTRVAIKIIHEALAKGKRILFIVPLLSLLKKTIDAFEEQGIHDIGVIQQRHPRTNPYARVQIASKQTLIKRPNLMQGFDVVIDDEAHKMYSEFSEWVKRDTKTVFIGLSASPGTKGMGLVYNGVVVGATIPQLMERKVICPLEVYDKGRPPSRKGLKIGTGNDFVEAQAEAVMSDKVLVADVYEMWVERGSLPKWFVFGQTCAHAKLLMESFEKHGVKCGYIDADTPQDERDSENPWSDAIFPRYRRGEIDVMFSVGCLGTGVDEIVYGLSLAYITRSRDKLTQDLGRGGRQTDGKDFCIVNDHGGNIETLGMPDTYDYSKLDCRDPKEKGDAQIDLQEPPKPKHCSQCKMLLPAETRVCPKCGEIPKPCMVETIPGKLVKRDGSQPKEKKPKKAKRDERQDFWSGLLYIQKEREYRPGWAYRQYRERFPEVTTTRGLHDMLMRPSPAVRKFVQEKRLSYIASKKNEAKTEVAL